MLVGDASANAVTARIQERLPLRRNAEGIWAGARRIAGPDGAYRLQYPSPVVPGRLLLGARGPREIPADRLIPVHHGPVLGRLRAEDPRLGDTVLGLGGVAIQMVFGKV